MQKHVDENLANALRKLIEATADVTVQKRQCTELFQCVYEAACAANDPNWQGAEGKRKALGRLFSAASAVLTAALHRAPDILSSLVEYIQKVPSVQKSKMPPGSNRLCITATGGEPNGFRTLYVTIGAGLISSHYIPTIVQGNYSVTGCGCGAFAESDVITEALYTLKEGGESDRQQLAVNKFAYLHAQFYHPILKAFAHDRAAFAFPDIFKLTTALTDPWKSAYQYFGIWDRSLSNAVATAMQRLQHLKSGFVVASDTIDEFLDFGLHVNKAAITPFNTSEKLTFSKKQIISTGSKQDELALIRKALEQGPNSAKDIRHRVIWRNAALALTTCENPPPAHLLKVFREKLDLLNTSRDEIGQHVFAVMDSWRK